ncbi:peptide ABC transporter substrate-binding protein [Stagnimonas aquatica]|uniref:Peptide ABC transporter substrate-binding protein n=1 Tax=Stagnimonas aquatica TaxID=2689987 RepID=A0A3N0VH19_9GAMM|nr:peptide ABC transporter substrate-binding protein [Stagnimonas aquatica]ROH91982.1 peptide ABC transporter substrate-binding protein [Stagnimonas aquatica]
MLAALLLCPAHFCAAESRLSVGNGNEPETLDPQRVEGVSASNIVRDLYEGLTSLSSRGEVVAGAAERWEVSPDGREYRFQLRAQARWSNGDPLTAEDFADGLRRSVDPATGSAYAQMLAPIEGATEVMVGARQLRELGVEVIDAQTLIIRLSSPRPYFLGLLSHPSTFPIHRPSLERWGKDFARPGRLVSNGAYTLESWTPQSSIRLKRNRYYWNDARTAIDTVVYQPSEDSNTELKRYRADELDVTYEIPLQQAPWLRQHYGQDLHVSSYLGTYFYGFNCSRPPFKDNPKLRRALTLAVDRQVIVDKVMNGLALPAYSLLPPGLSGYTPQRPEWADWSRERRLAEARRLYAEAGYSEQRPLEVELRYNTHEDHKRIATVVAAMWKQWLGVRTTLLNEEFKVFIQNRNLRKITQLFRAVWIADYDDPTAFTDILHSSHGQNDMAYSNPDYDSLLALAAAEADSERRRQHLAQAEQMLLRDQPLLPIYTYTSKHLVKPWVQGWQDNPLDIHYSKDLRIVGRPGEAAR